MSLDAFNTWADKARAVPIEREIERRGILLRGSVDRCGPCPKCGGDDRFSINTDKQVFNCRGCNVGGDVIELVEHPARKPAKCLTLLARLPHMR